MAPEWACSRCTFLNPSTQKFKCSICLADRPLSIPSSSSSASSNNNLSALRWSSSMQRQRSSSAFVIDLDLEPDEIANPALSSVFFPLQRCGSKRPALRSPKSITGEDDQPEERAEKFPRVKDVVDLDQTSEQVDFPKQKELKILTYNLWFREDLELHMRMKAISDIIVKHSPDLICFQEVTPSIYEILQSSNWWKLYKCSVSHEVAMTQAYFCMQLSKLPVKSFSVKPFSNSIMGRELSLADINIGGGKTFVLATSHLESPCPAPPKWDQMYSKERVAQAKESVSLLKNSPNVIFCGDMNWDDKLDGAFPLIEGWVDAWVELMPGENGWTYDTKANQMLSGNRTLQKRLDRCICSLQDFKIESIQMVGTEAIPGLSHVKEKRIRSEVKNLVLPVFPSDHFGLLLTISSL